MYFKAMLLATLLGGASAGQVRAEEVAPFHVSQTTRLVHPAEDRHWRGATTQALKTRIWLPVDTDIPERSHDIGPPGMPFFHAHPLSVDAPLSRRRDRYPLIVMSHGTGGSAEDMDWIAAPLAEAGYIVAAVDHPGNNSREPLTWDGFTLWWERARDLSDMLDALLADPALGSHIDRTRIGALGFSLGGYTVLELAGARTDLAGFLAFCKSPSADAICHPPEMDKVVDRPAPDAPPSDSTRASYARSGDDYGDPRIRAVFAIAPAVGQAFDATAFRKVTIPVALMAGTADHIVPPETNARHIAALLPTARLIMVPGAGHYSYLLDCGPAAIERLPALCTEEPGVDRAHIHAVAVEAAETFFAQTLDPQDKR